MNSFIFQKSDKFPFLKFVVKLELRHFNQTVVNSSIFSRTDSDQKWGGIFHDSRNQPVVKKIKQKEKITNWEILFSQV